MEYRFNGRVITVTVIAKWHYFGDDCRILREKDTDRAIFEYTCRSHVPDCVCAWDMLSEVGEKWQATFKSMLALRGYRVKSDYDSDVELGQHDKLVEIDGEQPTAGEAAEHNGWTGD